MTNEQYEAMLAEERLARQTAEHMLALKVAELGAAEKQLSDQSCVSSGQVISLRTGTELAQNDLDRAKSRVVQMERLLWTALETIPDGFAMFGPDFRLIAANKPYLEVFVETGGIAPGASYQSILETCRDEGLVDLSEEDKATWIDRMLARWDSPHIKPVTIRFANDLYVKMVDRRTSDGGVVSLALNITSNIFREKELMEACDKAEAAERAKSTFLAKMSHELRTPMNGVVGMADLLAERELDEEARLYTNTIRSSGQALLDIINNILDFSKMEASRFELRSDPFDLEQLVQDVSLIIGPSLRDRSVELMVDYDQFLPTEFVGDAGRLRQILLNLVGNAAKFTIEGGILVRVVGIPDKAAGMCQLHFTVEDSGIGIPSGMVDHIFGEFNQIEDEANRNYEGTGLGLAITRKLIEAMDGDIWVDSELGEGSTFGFRISLACPETSSGPVALLPEGLSHVVVWAESMLDKALLERQLMLLGLDASFVTNAKELALSLKEQTADIMLCAPAQAKVAKQVLTKLSGGTSMLTYATRFDEPADLPKPFTRKMLHGLLSDVFVRPCEIKAEIPLRILAAEDNKTNQLVLSKMLEGLEIDLRFANDGLEAVEAYQSDPPDLMFMDISMPKMDGMAAARKIRELETNGRHVTIVAMTAHAMADDEKRILDSGIDMYLTKPLKKDTLINLIAEASRALRQAS